MKTLAFMVCAATLLFLAPPRSFAQSSSFDAERVVVSSGGLRLEGLLWKPTGSGPFAAILFSHGAGRTDPANARSIGPVFAKHGYVFLYLFRRGHGLSSEQGQFMGDLVREATARSEDARHLQFVLLTTDHFDDTMAGLSFLKNRPDVDSSRLASAGHSFGGQLTLLAAERDSTIKAAVTFAAGAQLWAGSSELRERLLTAVRNIKVPVFLTHAANDFSTLPGEAMAGEMARLKKPHQLKIYPAVGETSSAGHMAVFTDVATWEGDVFRFLDEHVQRLRR